MTKLERLILLVTILGDTDIMIALPGIVRHRITDSDEECIYTYKALIERTIDIDEIIGTNWKISWN